MNHGIGRAQAMPVGPRVAGHAAIDFATTRTYGRTAMETKMRSGAQDSTGVVLGVLLVLAGVLFLGVQLVPFDIGQSAWPLFVIVPGLALIAVSLTARVLAPFAIIGSITLVAGMILALQTTFGAWAAWSYAWALVFPGAVGLGVAIIGAQRHDTARMQRGLWMVATGVTLAAIFGMFFEGMLHVSGVTLAPAFGIVMPLLIVALGLALLLASVLSKRNRAE